MLRPAVATATHMNNFFFHNTGKKAAVFVTSAAITSLLLARPTSSLAPPNTHPVQELNMTTASYTPRHKAWPYTASDMQRQDSTSDSDFYSAPRFVTHIDDGAISRLRQYYDQVLPQKGSILDFCSSWVSHYPKRVETSVAQGDTTVYTAGMNAAELAANDLVKSHSDRQILADLNDDPASIVKKLPASASSTPSVNAITCVVSIDYLIKPLEVLSSLRTVTAKDGTIHLAISNRCFPTKVVGRWLRVDEEERLQMVGDYLWFAGWRDIEIVELPPVQENQDDLKGVDPNRISLQRLMAMFGGGSGDPLWVVRAVNRRDEKSEL